MMGFSDATIMGLAISIGRINIRYLLHRHRTYAIYPLGGSLAEAEQRLNFPMEDKLHNLQVYIVDLPSTMATAKECN